MQTGRRGGGERRGDHGERVVRSVFLFPCLLPALCWLSVQPACGEQRDLLDLTLPSVAAVERARKTGCEEGRLGGAIDGPPARPRSPGLSLRIASLDPLNYKPGGDLTALLVLANTGQSPVLVPWTVESSLVYSEGCERVHLRPGVKALVGEIGILVEDDLGNKQAQASHGLFAVSSNPGSFRELPPGESLSIKIGGQLDLSWIQAERQKANAPLSFPLTLKVVATFELHDGIELTGGSPLISVNQLRITVDNP